MDIGIVSMRYAKALIEYAKDTGAEDRVYHELRMLERSFRKHPDLREALDNPILKIKEKFALICTAAVGNGEVSRDLYRKLKHIGVGKLITAVPVSRDVWERIRNSASTLLHAQMELQTEVDPSIEGGFIFDINDFRLDASIATQLKRVKQQFIDKNRRIV